jgi:hypothetical protein
VFVDVSRLLALRNNDAGKAFVDALILSPKPRLSETETHDDLKQLALYIRKRMISLASNNEIACAIRDGKPLSADACRLTVCLFEPH